MKYCRCRSANSGWCTADRIAAWAVTTWWSLRLKGMRRRCHILSHQCRLVSDAGITDGFPSIGPPLTAACLKGGGAYAVTDSSNGNQDSASHLNVARKTLDCLHFSHYTQQKKFFDPVSLCSCRFSVPLMCISPNRKQNQLAGNAARVSSSCRERYLQPAAPQNLGSALSDCLLPISQPWTRDASQLFERNGHPMYIESCPSQKS